MKKVIKSLLLLVVSVFLVLSCAATHAQRNWLEQPATLQTDAFGVWITVKTLDNQEVAGELIAVSNDSVFIAGETLSVIAKAKVKSARLVAFNSNAGSIAVLSFLSTLATPFVNGYFFIFTAPMWLIGGTVTSIIRSHDPIMEYPDHKWEELALFARYPQGLPLGITRSKIKMKHKQTKVTK